MSYGLCICSNCGTEVHQGRRWRDDRDELYWYHCHDKTPIKETCNGSAAYPKSPSEIKGKPCGADDLDEVFVKRQKVRR